MREAKDHLLIARGSQQILVTKHSHHDGASYGFTIGDNLVVYSDHDEPLVLGRHEALALAYGLLGMLDDN